MNLCDDEHGEVCFESIECPACYELKKSAERDEIIKVLRDEIKDLRDNQRDD